MPFMGTLSGIGSLAGDVSRARDRQEEQRRQQFKEQVEQAYLNLAQQQAAWREKFPPYAGRASMLSPEQKADDAKRFINAIAPNADDATKQNLLERYLKLTPQNRFQKALVLDDDPESATGVREVWMDTTTNQELPTSISNVVVPSMQPVDRNVYKQVPQADGSIKLVPVTETTQRRLPAAGPAGAATGPSVGPGKVVGHVPPTKALPSLVSDQEAGDIAAQIAHDKDANWTRKYPLAADRTKIAEAARKRGIALPSAGGAASARQREMVAGLNTLHVSLFGGMDGQGKAIEGLANTVNVLDDKRRRWLHLVPAWTFMQSNMSPSYWSRLTPETLNSYLKAAGRSMLTDREAQYVFQMNRAITAIQALRPWLGNPRSSEQLILRFMAELPDPSTTQDSKDARYKMTLIEREIRAAIEGANLDIQLPTPTSDIGTNAPGVSVQPWQKPSAAIPAKPGEPPLPE